MKLSIIIPAYNEEYYISDCLDSIFAQTAGAACDTEIIVVDNASTDRTAEIVRRYPKARLVHEPQKGVVRARQAGYLAATGDIIANIDADTRLTSGWIAKVAAAFGNDDKLVGLSGPAHFYDLSRKTKIMIDLVYYFVFFSYFINRFVLRKGSVVQGANLAIRRSALQSIGGYDTTIDFYGDDTDIARRLHKVGKVRYTYKIPVMTSGRRIAKEGVSRTLWHYGINYLWVMTMKRPFTTTSTDIRPSHKNGDGF